MPHPLRHPARFLLVLLGWLLATAAAAAPLAPAAPLSQALNPDGTLRPGVRGSFSAQGYALGRTASGQPVFSPAGPQRALGPGDESWSDAFGLPGTSNPVYAVACAPNGEVYVGGLFTIAGKVQASRVARWDGRNWSALGSGIGSGVVYALALDGQGSLYAGGIFTQAGGVAVNNIARWNGTAWAALGSGTDGSVKALAVDAGGNLYAGGYFAQAGGVAAPYVARWNGTAWTALGGGLGAAITALAVDPAGMLYAGTTTNSGSGNTVSRWTGSAWVTLPGALPAVYALAFDSNGIPYAATNSGVARWNGSAWSFLNNGPNNNWQGRARALAFVGNTLYAGGYFGITNSANQLTASSVASWDGSSWQPLAQSLTNNSPTGGDVVYALGTAPGGRLYVGGEIAPRPTAPGTNITAWDGQQWSQLGEGINQWVNAVVADGNGTCYVAGLFTQIGSTPTPYVAKWNGTAWAPLGAGPAGAAWISSLALDATGNLYAGGSTAAAGSGYASFVARWNGSTWTQLGGSFSTGTYYNTYLTVLATDNVGTVYAGGNFTQLDGAPLSYLARWTGTAWAAVGGGVNGSVSALLADGSGGVYVGGNFTQAGGASASYLARWSGTTWSAVGAGASRPVLALASDGSGGLYVSGYSYQTGSGYSSSLHHWTGSTWTTLPTVGSEPINTLVRAANGELYAAGGRFMQAGGLTHNIGHWDGTSWHGLGTGLNGQVQGMAFDNTGGLLAGGSFLTLGDGSKVSYNLAYYKPGSAPLATVLAAAAADVQLYPNPATGTATLALPAALGQQLRTAELLNSLGQVVRRYALPAGSATHLLDLTQLPAGIYTLRLPGCAGVGSRQLLVR